SMNEASSQSPFAFRPKVQQVASQRLGTSVMAPFASAQSCSSRTSGTSYRVSATGRKSWKGRIARRSASHDRLRSTPPPTSPFLSGGTSSLQRAASSRLFHGCVTAGGRASWHKPCCLGVPLRRGGRDDLERTSCRRLRQSVRCEFSRRAGCWRSVRRGSGRRIFGRLVRQRRVVRRCLLDGRRAFDGVALARARRALVTLHLMGRWE